MLDPRQMVFDRTAFKGQMILVGTSEAYAYDNGKRTDVVTGVRCNVVLPDYNYERLNVKLPVKTMVDEDLIGCPVAFTGFCAKVYVMEGRVGFSATADGVAAGT